MSTWDRDAWWRGAAIGAIVVLGAVVAYGLFVPERVSSVAQAQPAASSDNPTPEEPPIPVVSVVGDSYTAGSPENSTGKAWPTLLQANLPVQVAPSAAGGNGYNLSDPENFAKLAAQIVPKSSVVVLFGSINDQDGYAATADGARAALRAVAGAAPDAAVVVVGPAVPELALGAEVPPLLLESRDALRDVAGELGVSFIDPIELGWFVDRPDLMGADSIHPNDAGHQYLYAQFRQIVEPLLG